MERPWTEEQLSAIDNRDKTLLVSAAAGSGKTATLTERIIRSLTDSKKKMNIDSILVVTFTTTAAGELREKISDALNEEILKRPNDDHLKRQLHLLPSARISTIDSFCNDILRNNCDRVGVSPGYRIADGAECELLAISIIEGLIEAIYNGELPEVATPEEFEELCDCLTDSGRVEEISGVLRFIHLRCENAEDGVDLLSRLRENFVHGGSPVEETFYGSYLMERYREMVEHYLPCIKKYLDIFTAGNSVEQKYIDTAKADYDLLLALKHATTYEEVKPLMATCKLADRAKLRDEEPTEVMLRYVSLREMMRPELYGMKSYFLYTTEQWHSLLDSLYRLVGVLHRFEVEFDRLFLEEKRRRGAFSYADIERYTYKCLIQDGELTDIAHNVARQYDAIYIDEYQDVNQLQNRIFEAISRPDNRFMVGDIKQSIYGFRSACPEIFAEMKKTFPPLDGSTGECASIFMSRNFRCDRGIVDFVNNIFDRAFGFTADSIGYVSSDRLEYSKPQKRGEPEYRYPEVCMIDKGGDDNATTPEVVAMKVAELIRDGRLNDGTPIKASDIAIILRYTSGKDGKYAAALEALGIPACISDAESFFLSPEVLLALCLLNTIDNPRRDIYLAGLLCSPLFNFDAEDLFRVKQYKCDSLYESLCLYSEANPDFTKGASFLRTLDYYRSIAEGMSVDGLIRKLYRETGLMSLASRSGGKENLTLLYDYARSYEAGSFKGLYNFISFINNIIDKKTTFDDARARTGVDAVKIITAHSSKGLEYPIVIFAEADARITNRDKEKRLIISEDFGISFRLRSPSGLALVNSPVHDIINDRIGRKIFEEELRVLYVALTRARERLFVVGRCPTVKRAEYDLDLSVLAENMSEYSFRTLSSYLEIILMCEGSRPKNAKDFCGFERKEEGRDEENPTDEAEKPVYDDRLYDTLTQRFGYEYHSLELTTLPEKMSVSTMSPTVLDGSETDTVSLTIEEEDPVDLERDTYRPIVRRKTLPAFALGTDEEESAKRGVATHLFMQFCSFDRLIREGSEAELRHLVDDGFISREDSLRVRLDEIELFRSSSLIREMLSAHKVHRELRFNVYLPAAHFTSDEARRQAYRDRDILVQGVIDCIIERSDGSIILCDYKTDRLTRRELADRSLAEKKLREAHSMQLGLYSLAIEKIFGKKPDKVEIYSLPLGDTVSVI